MRLIRYINNTEKSPFFESSYKGCVATIGNFDGLHRGHQAIFEQLKSLSREYNLPSVIITFEPLPREYFFKNDHNVRLTRFKEKWLFLEKLGIDIVVCLHFNATLAQWSASKFIQQLLINTLNTKHLIVGEDFRFGHQREGNVALLTQHARNNNFVLEVATSLNFENSRISSTRVREALKMDNLILAEKLLGRPYSLLGKVIHGDKRARQWGIPTANLNIQRSIIPTVLPVKGVYAVYVDLKGRKNLPGVANVGRRPTFNGFRHLLEVHLLNFNEMIYDQIIEVKFAQKLREEQRFDSVELLKQQILQDVETARKYFNHGNKRPAGG